MFKDLSLSISVGFLLIVSVFILNSIAHTLFPLYFIYIILALILFWFFSQIGYEVISLFSTHLYVISIFFLVLTLVIGRVTHNTIRWIPIGSFTLQPSELVRPFLLIFFANYLTKEKVTMGRFLKAVGLIILPAILILVQPSFSVSVLALVGFLGVLIASDFNKKYLLIGLAGLLVLIPIFWQIMAPYQRQRLVTFFEPTSDPLGAGYNSIQSVVAAGDGELMGRGLGHGIQTQLSFLPEKQTDFVFAAVAEEMGFVGATLMLVATFVILFRLTKFMENSVSPSARAYLSGFFLTYVIQVFVHVGMNMGIFPVTGLPFPLVSAGGSSLLATMMGLGIALGACKKYS
jgi:cell division protein FtsW (lipid II flippase)